MGPVGLGRRAPCLLAVPRCSPYVCAGQAVGVEHASTAHVGPVQAHARVMRAPIQTRASRGWTIHAQV